MDSAPVTSFPVSSVARWPHHLNWAGVALLCCSLFAGCGRRDEITQYKVERVTPPPPDQAKMPPGHPDVGSNPVSTDQRAWFFKVTGAAEQLASHTDEFSAFIDSVQFTGGQPTWSLPEGWIPESASQMRFATLRIGSAEPPLEVSVIPLPVMSADPQQYVRDNIDRWRTQLGLTPYTTAEWTQLTKSDATEASEDWSVRELTAGPRPTTLVRLRGKTPDTDDALMLGAIVLPPATIEQRPPVAGTSQGRGEGLTYEAPAGWEAGASTPFSKANFAVSDGDEQISISVSTAGGDLLANINRWRGQIGLAPELTPQALGSQSRKIVVDGNPGTLVELEGDEEMIVGAVVPHGDQQWFFKLKGSKKLARRQQQNFDGFLKSVKFQ